MTELTFLIELLLNHNLPKPTKDLIASRIKEVEQTLQARPAPIQKPQPLPIASNLQQAPSTLALMAKHGDIPQDLGDIPEHFRAEMPVTQVAQTPATVAAMAARNQAINAAVAGKIDKTTGRPRKF